jgi:hypothetical protein
MEIGRNTRAWIGGVEPHNEGEHDPCREPGIHKEGVEE